MTLLMAELNEMGSLNFICLGIFLSCWIGYARFAHFMAKRTASLSSVLHVHRINWMRRMLQREVRVGDAALIANIERNVNFFASSCVLIIAGLLTATCLINDFCTVNRHATTIICRDRCIVWRRSGTD